MISPTGTPMHPMADIMEYKASHGNAHGNTINSSGGLYSKSHAMSGEVQCISRETPTSLMGYIPWNPMGGTTHSMGNRMGSTIDAVGSSMASTMHQMGLLMGFRKKRRGRHNYIHRQDQNQRTPPQARSYRRFQPV